MRAARGRMSGVRVGAAFTVNDAAHLRDEAAA